MKHLKKILAVALVCVMALTVLTGCGKSVQQYTSEINGKLGANSGITADQGCSDSAKKLIDGVKKIGIPELIRLANDPTQAQAIAEKIMKDAGLSTETSRFSLAATGYGQKVMVGMDGKVSNSGDASTFFADQLKKNNETEGNLKVTKYGIATYSIVGIDIVVMVAQ